MFGRPSRTAPRPGADRPPRRGRLAAWSHSDADSYSSPARFSQRGLRPARLEQRLRRAHAQARAREQTRRALGVAETLVQLRRRARARPRARTARRPRASSPFGAGAPRRPRARGPRSGSGARPRRAGRAPRRPSAARAGLLGQQQRARELRLARRRARRAEARVRAAGARPAGRRRARARPPRRACGSRRRGSAGLRGLARRRDETAAERDRQRRDGEREGDPRIVAAQLSAQTSRSALRSGQARSSEICSPRVARHGASSESSAGARFVLRDSALGGARA